MIAFVRGILSEIEDGKVVVDCGALGYEVNVPSQVLESARIGSEIRLYTWLNVREDEMSLFGFLGKDELRMFRLLLSVGGIGPKVALSVLSSLSCADLRFAILAGDAKTISRAPGVGSKTAQRVVLELRDKVSLSDAFGSTDEGLAKTPAAASSDNSAKNDALIALTELGFSSSEALKAVSAVATEGRTADEILKDALKTFGR